MKRRILTHITMFDPFCQYQIEVGHLCSTPPLAILMFLAALCLVFTLSDEKLSPLPFIKFIDIVVMFDYLVLQGLNPALAIAEIKKMLVQG